MISERFNRAPVVDKFGFYCIYFTGLELPHSILAINADEEKSILFAPKRDVRFESASRKNDFPGRPLSDDPNLTGISGIPNSKPYEQFEDTIRRWIDRGLAICFNCGNVIPGLIAFIIASETAVIICNFCFCIAVNFPETGNVRPTSLI